MLAISKFESEFLNSRIARVDLDTLDDAIIEKIRASAIEQNLDIIRLKIDSAVNAQQLLKKLSFPFSFSGGITEYVCKASFTELQYCKQKLEFVEITKKDMDLFKEFFYATFNEHDIGYHNDPYLSEIIQKKNELDCLYQYYADFINKDKHQLIFLKKDEELIGFSTIQFNEEGILLLPITGILPKYRSKGLYYDLCESYTRYIIDNNLVCIFSSRNENNIARLVYSSFAFKHYSSKYNYNITPLLNKNILESVIVVDNYRFSSIENFIAAIKNTIPTQNTISLKQLKQYFKQSFDRSINCKLEISQPFSNDTSTLYIIKLIQNDEVQAIFWLEYEFC